MNLLERDNEIQEEQEKKETYEPDRRPLIAILLAVVVVLVICIVIVLVTPTKRSPAMADSDETLQQNITDYANEQKQNDQKQSEQVTQPTEPSQEVIVVEPPASQTPENAEEKQEPSQEAVTSDTIDKTAIVVSDNEDENDVSYTKEYILNEMLPYFADNNLDAIWDLAHLLRYVKLSAGLKGTNSYYYRGDVDANGLPHGVGLAIYEENSYYYGSWSHGVRSGDGRWYRFYIDEIGKPTTKKIYQAHSYAGQWSNDLPNGQGAEHYDVDTSNIEDGRVIQNVVGNFTNGLYDGEMYANTVNRHGNVEEWNAVAQNGVFQLWRDMSAIGECAVWQHRDDAELCLDIDKSENKNQGMRELLKITGTE